MPPGPDLAGVAVLVVNYGSTSLIRENIADLCAAHPELLVVVVDNWSTESERALLSVAAEELGWSTILPSENLGFGAAMNRAAAAAIDAGARHLLLLNPDARIGATAVAELRSTVRAEPDVLVAPRIVRPDGSVWFDGSDLYLEDGRTRSRRRRSGPAERMEWLTGACLMIDAELWFRVGGFDDHYFLYWEDVDLSWKVLESGGRLVVRSDVTVVHDAGGTQGAAVVPGAPIPKSPLYYYFNIRNRMVFATLRLERRRVRSWWRHAIPVSYEVLLRGGRRQLLGSTRPMIAAMRGLVDAFVMQRAITRGQWPEVPSFEERLRRRGRPAA